MAINAIFYDNQSRQITYEQLCRDILRVTPMRVANDVMGISNINMFAKYKPVRKSAPSYVRYSDYWKADDGMCGINIPLVPNLAAVLTANWSYVRPRSGMGSNEPAIVSDFYFFGRYKWNATPFLCPSSFPREYEYQLNVPFEVDFSNMTAGVGDDNLKMSDVPFLANKYLAVCIGNSLNYDNVVTANATIGNGGTSVTLSAGYMARLNPGKHKIYHFMTTERKPEGVAEPIRYIYPVYSDSTHPNPQVLDVVYYSTKMKFSAITKYTTSFRGTLRDVATASNVYHNGFIYFQVTVSNPTNATITEYLENMLVNTNYAENLYDTRRLKDLLNANWTSQVLISLPAYGSAVYYLQADTSFFPATGAEHRTNFSFRIKNALVTSVAIKLVYNN